MPETAVEDVESPNSCEEDTSSESSDSDDSSNDSSSNPTSKLGMRESMVGDFFKGLGGGGRLALISSLCEGGWKSIFA